MHSSCLLGFELHVQGCVILKRLLRKRNDFRPGRALGEGIYFTTA